MPYQNTVTLFGGSGFIGSHLVSKLAKAGFRIKIATRNCEKVGHLRTAGEVGQIVLMQCDLCQPYSLEAVIEGSDSIIYLPGVLVSSGKQNFDNIHHHAPHHIAQLALKHNIANYIYMSALGANPQSKAKYAQSKANGEQAIRNHIHNATIIRPSIVFGHGDGFFNRLAPLVKYSPIIPCFYANAQFQPVSVHDVCEAIVLCLTNSKLKGLTFELTGPDIMTMEQLLKALIDAVQSPAYLLKMPNVVAYFLAICSIILPKSIITLDQIKMLCQEPNVSSANSPGFKELGIRPNALASELPAIVAAMRYPS